MYLKYLLAWIPIVILAFANAAIRQAGYAKYVSELAAHQSSTLTICVAVGVYAWLLSGCLKLHSPAQAIGVGPVWLVMTVIFETVLGHYVLGNPWSQVLRDYNILEGRVWGLFLPWHTLASYVFYKIKG